MHHTRYGLSFRGPGSTAYAIYWLDALGGRMSVRFFDVFIDSGIESYSMKPDELKQQCRMMLIDAANGVKTIYDLQWLLRAHFTPKSSCRAAFLNRPSESSPARRERSLPIFCEPPDFRGRDSLGVGLGSLLHQACCKI